MEIKYKNESLDFHPDFTFVFGGGARLGFSPPPSRDFTGCICCWLGWQALEGHWRGPDPHIADGYAELTKHPEKYKQYEAENGWGTVSGCKRFFKQILDDWDDFCNDSWTGKLADVTYFWIE